MRSKNLEIPDNHISWEIQLEAGKSEQSRFDVPVRNAEASKSSSGKSLDTYDKIQ